MKKKIRNKILLACSIGKNTGAYVRGKYLAKSLSKQGYKIDYLNTFKSMPWGLYYLLSIPHNFIRIMFKKFDIGIALKPYPNTMYPILLKKLTGAKAIIDIDDLDTCDTGIMGKIMKIVQRPFLKYFDLILVHNENLFHLVTEKLGLPKNKVLQIEQGVDLEIFKSLENKKEIRKNLGYENKEKLLVYTGHLNVASHLKDILEAFKLIINQDKNIKLIIVGGGPDVKYYKNLVKEMGLENFVDMTGYIDSQEKITQYLNIADACVVYYPAEDFNKYRCSMKLREYLAVGIPAVCNNFGDLSNFKEYTYSFNTGDMQAFKKMISKAIYGPDGREKKGKEFVKSNMSWDSITKKIDERIKKC